MYILTTMAIFFYWMIYLKFHFFLFSGLPQLSIEPSNYEFGSTAVLICTDSSYVSNRPFVWVKDSTTIFTNGKTEPGKYNVSNVDGSFSLYITDIVASDEGNYSCKNSDLDVSIAKEIFPFGKYFL